ncbi:hypothetical protein [Flavobacterium sp. N1736]|uniref:hypothetical protein n=1 Tax=Flavobacterium sp. N1736 TaxID=2986823 RepID=UPI00222492E9|nr:hypothetical protein [Flavobacterium sp. N1736]
MRNIIFLLFLLIKVSSYSQEKKCSDFKNGTFKYKNPAYKNFIVIRNGNLQTEEDKSRKLLLEGSVQWVSECQYILTYTKINLPTLKNLIGQKVFVTINKIENNKINCLSKMNDKSLDLEMIKIK